MSPRPDFRRREPGRLIVRHHGDRRSARQRTGGGQFFLPLVLEQLEDRRMLDAGLVGEIRNQLAANFAPLDAAIRTDLSSHILPLIGGALGTLFDPLGSFATPLSQLPASPTDIMQLSNALDAIPGIDVINPPTHLDDPAQLRLRFTTQTTITVPLTKSFGPLHLDLGGAVDLAISLDFQFTVATFYNGPNSTLPVAYIDPTNDQLSISASITGSHFNTAARLGFADVNVAHGLAHFSGNVSIDLTDPGTGSPDGRITFSELSGAVGQPQVQASSGPSAEFDLSSSLVAGTQHLSIAWPSVNDTSSVTTNLGTLGVYQQLEQLSASVVSAGLSSLATWAGAVGGSQNLLGRPLPIVGTQLKDALDIAGLFKSRFVDQVGSFNSAQTLATRLTNVGGLQNLVTHLENNELTYRLDLNTSISKGLNIDLGLDDLLDLQLDTNSLNLQASVAAAITFGVDLTTQTFFLADDGPQPELRVNAAIDVMGLSAGVHVGFLSANATNGSIHFSANASLDASDPSGDHRIDTSDMAGGAGTIGSFMTMALAGSGSVQLTIDAPLVGIAGKSLFANWPDINDASAFTTNAGDFVDLNSYKNIAASQFSFGLKQLTDSLVTFVEDAHGGNNPLLIPLPLVKKSIAELIDLDTLLHEQITKYTDVVQDQVTGALNQPFQTSQQLLDLLKNLPGGGPNKATEKVESSDLKYTLQLDKTIQKTFPFQLDVASALDLQVSGSVTVNLVIHVDVTFGVNKDTRIFFVTEQA